MCEKIKQLNSFHAKCKLILLVGLALLYFTSVLTNDSELPTSNLKLKYACKIAQLTQICLKSANLYHDNRLIAASFIHLSWLGKVLEETRINVHLHTSPPLIKGPLLAGG